MAITFSEADYENSIIELFKGMGYQYSYGPDIVRDFSSPLYDEVLEDYIYRLNKDKNKDAIKDALSKLRNFENADLVTKNKTFMNYLQNGIEAKYFENGEERSTLIYLVDYTTPSNNSFIIANQWTFI